MTFKRHLVVAAAVIAGATSSWAQGTADAAHQHQHGEPDSLPKAKELGGTSSGHDGHQGKTQAQPTGHQMEGMDHGDMTDAQGGTPPEDARDPHGYAGGYRLGEGKYALPEGRILKLADEHTFAAVQMNRFERTNDNAFAYDGQAWFGTDYSRLVFKAEGERVNGKLEEARSEVLWSRAFSPYWDGQLGVRFDNGEGTKRQWLAMGVQGMAPYWFEIDAAFYLGQGGRTALRLGAEYELQLTQKLVLQPRAELNIYGKTDEDDGIGRGISSGVAGLRLRYEINRQVAPYIGVEWKRKFGVTADLARAAGEPVSGTEWVAGVRFWF